MFSYYPFSNLLFTVVSALGALVPVAQVLEHPFRDRDMGGLNLGRAILKALKWYQWIHCLVLSIIRQALASSHLTNIT